MRRLKAAAIGSGLIGVAHVEVLKCVPGVDVVILVDIVDPVQKAEESDVPNGFSDYCEMVEVVEPDCTHTRTPNHTHKETAPYAFKHGIHVICEKPMVGNVGEAKEMLEVAKKSNLVHVTNLHSRFYPANHQLRNMILDGALGKIYGVYGTYLQDCSFKESDFNWCMLFDKGGSTHVTSNIGSHWIDLAEYVTGSKVKEVFVEFQTNLPVREMDLAGDLKDIAADIEDTSHVMVCFENGAISSVVFSQVYQGRKNQTTIRVSGSEISTEWDSEVIGDLKLGCRNESNRLLTRDRGPAHLDTAPTIIYPGGHTGGFPDALKQNFTAVYEVIRGVKPINPYANFEDGLHQVQVLDKIFESTETGC